MKNDILCIVSDNGNGMDLDIIKKLQSGDIKAQGNGVGLINLDERLKSLYRFALWSYGRKESGRWSDCFISGKKGGIFAKWTESGFYL